jgi:polyhydroxybutyrate depolymerase
MSLHTHRRLFVLVLFVSLLVANVGTAPVVPARAAACPAPSAAVTTGSRAVTFNFGSLERRYLLHVPASYDPAQPTPLVISMHGFASNPEQQASFARWEKIAATEPMIVVYPQGTGFPARWNAGTVNFYGASTVDDVGFIRELVAKLSAEFCLDPARIFANGLSNGGGMSNRLACQASDLIAAIGGVAGAYSPVECKLTRAVPVIAFHGTKDTVVNYEGVPAVDMPPITDWAKAWAERNECKLTPTALPAVEDTSGILYADCKDGAEVALYTVDGGGHVWPGGPRMGFLGKTSPIDATPILWEFFKRHPMPAGE